MFTRGHSPEKKCPQAKEALKPAQRRTFPCLMIQASQEKGAPSQSGKRVAGSFLLD